VIDRAVWKLATPAALLVAALTASAAFAEQPGQVRIAFSTTYSTNCLPYFVAQDMGWLAQEGVQTADLMLNSDANATRALVTGSADMAMTGPLNVFSAVESGARIKWIGTWQEIVDYDVVAGASIGSLNQLVDKTFASSGPGGLPQDLPVMLFKKLGLPYDKVRFVSIGAHAARMQAVIAGKADAALVNEITAQIGIKAGQVHLIASVPEYFPKLGYIALVVRQDALDNPERRKAFLGVIKASIRGARFVASNPDKAAEILHSHVKELDLDIIKTVAKRLTAQNVWPVKGGLDRGVVEFTANTLYDLGQLKSPPSIDKAIDPSLVQEAVKSLGDS
jgi:ABC-type nitrate/sulfonate/bicarbonate transport system substrate-binding protein